MRIPLRAFGLGTVCVLVCLLCGCEGREESLTSELRKRLATHLMGMKVETNAGEELGRVQDLLFDGIGEVKYVVVGAEGLADDSRPRIVPPRALFLGTVKRDTLALDLRKEAWNKAPLFMEETSVVGQSEPEIHQFFLNQSTNTGLPRVGSTGPGEVHLTPVGRSTGRPDFSASGHPLMAASDLIGKPVRNGQSQQLGKVQDLLVDFAGGKVALAIVEVDEPVAGAKRFALPLRSLRKGASGGVVADVPWETLRDAGALDAAKWQQAGTMPTMIFRFETQSLRLGSQL